ncbi:50S ribosomal protein L35ae [Candidatus Altiarchaeota archaeon]
MEAVVINYRGGKRTQNNKQMVLQPVETSTRDEAGKLIGKKVEWTSPAGKKLEGKVTRAHGGKGAVIAAFDAGLPGQSLGTKVQIL